MSDVRELSKRLLRSRLGAVRFSVDGKLVEADVDAWVDLGYRKSPAMRGNWSVEDWAADWILNGGYPTPPPWMDMPAPESPNKEGGKP